MSKLDELPVAILQLIFGQLDTFDLQRLTDSSSKIKLIIENTPELMQKLNDDSLSPFESFPVEIHERIFSHLLPADLCGIASTCRTFSSIINGSERLSKSLTLYMRYPKDVKEFVKDITNTSRRFKSLHIKRTTSDATRLSDEIDASTARNFYTFMKEVLGPKIEHLTISWKNPASIRDINYTAELQRILRPNSRRLLPVNENVHRVPLHVLLHNLENNLPNQDFIGERHLLRNRGNLRGAPREDDAAAAAQIRLQVNQIRDDIVKEFFDLIRCFTNVKSLQLKNVNLERSAMGDISVDFPHLTRFSIQECDHNCYAMLASATRLRFLEVYDGSSFLRENAQTRMNNFEDFLLSQTSLRSLRMVNFVMPRFLSNDRSSEVQFKLTSLAFKSVNFASHEYLNKFIETQNELKSVEFQMYNERSVQHDRSNFFNGFLSIITNPRKMQLNSITIDKVDYLMTNCDFLRSYQNPHVKRLVFQVTSDDRSSELFKVLLKIFTNLEVIEFKTVDHEESESLCFDEGTVLPNCTSLNIINSSVRSLSNITAPNLAHFKFVPERSGGYIDDVFGGFFIRHRNIKTVVIGNCTRSYFFVSFILVKTIVDFLCNLEHVTIYNFNEVNKSVKLLCSLPKLRSLTLSSDDHQQFAAKTKVECARSNLKLISVNIGAVDPADGSNGAVSLMALALR